MVWRVSRHCREIILMVTIFDFEKIYILYKFLKISVETILRKIKLNVHNIL